jgi:hypothetical protein
MSDPYIDQFETQVYGKFAREQMKEVCSGRVPELDPVVAFAIAAQQKADEEMQAALDRQPRDKPVIAGSDALKTARDLIVRFGSYLESLKGHPVDPSRFFRSENPSVLARRRITKLVAALEYIVGEIDKSGDKIKDAESWRGEFVAAHEALAGVEKQHRASRVAEVDLEPEIAAARDRWLDVYANNKALIRGLLGHAGKPELMPFVFDDLAETHRTSGTSDAESSAAVATATGTASAGASTTSKP